MLTDTCIKAIWSETIMYLSPSMLLDTSKENKRKQVADLLDNEAGARVVRGCDWIGKLLAFLFDFCGGTTSHLSAYVECELTPYASIA